MAVSSSLAALPKYLKTAWCFTQDDHNRARKHGDLADWDVASLALACYEFQLEKFDSERSICSAVPLSLSAMSTGKVIELLEASDNLEKDVISTLENLNSTTVRQLLEDPRVPYHILRACLNYTDIPGIELVDLDKAILSNERHMRNQGPSEDQRYLVTLGMLTGILRTSRASNPSTFVRNPMPYGGFEFLDEHRKDMVQFHSTDAEYISTFDRITKGILRGLDWSNVMCAGGMALTTLLHTDPAMDNDRSVSDCDIDIYLYGLTAREANEKVAEIYAVWWDNLPPTNQQILIVKNAKTITFIPSYPNRRMQIVLKLVPSPMHILLNFDLDACAIGFDGVRVLMLPRFARAIETGYSVFTMDLIWGHHLGDRRATQEVRVFKYANRGFGLRILPAYIKALEEDGLRVSPGVSVEAEDRPLYDRKPYGRDEPGLKTLKRIAYLGQDYVWRYYFGATPLTTFYNPKNVWKDEQQWKHQYEMWLGSNRLQLQTNRKQHERGEPLVGPTIDIAELDGNAINTSLPGGRSGLGCFELFMRHCKAWKMDARGEATLDTSSFTSNVYDPEDYDDSPAYEWGPDFDTLSFARSIDAHNDQLFLYLKTVICHKLRIPQLSTGCMWNLPPDHFIGQPHLLMPLDRGYLTRRIRRQVYGPDLDSVMAKQITLPIMIPIELEDSLSRDLAQRPKIPTHRGAQSLLIPVHDPSNHDPSGPLPSLHDSNSGSNLRYWVVTNESMWAGQHRAVDEASEVLWALFYWFTDSVRQFGQVGTDEKCLWHLARAFRRRIVLPEVPAGDEDKSSRCGLPRREALLFRHWAMHTPKKRRVYEDPGILKQGAHELFGEDAYLYPFPDELFWKDDDLIKD